MLATLPEELVHEILAYSLVSEPSTTSSDTSRSSTSPCPTPSAAPLISRAGRGKLSPLLVSKQLYRIGLPLYWHTLRITSDEQCRLLAETPSKAKLVRSLQVEAVFANLGKMLQVCAQVAAMEAASGSFEMAGLRAFDCNLTVPDDLPSDDEDDFNFQTDVVGSFVMGLKMLRDSLKHLTIRKASTTYLTVPWVQDVLDGVGTENWTALVSISPFPLLSSLSSSSETWAVCMGVRAFLLVGRMNGRWRHFLGQFSSLHN